jgi:hypothetical protein
MKRANPAHALDGGLPPLSQIGRTGYWKILNAFGKVVGIGFILVGAVIVIYGMTQRDWLIGVPALVLAVLGVLLTLARPSRPET